VPFFFLKKKKIQFENIKNMIFKIVGKLKGKNMIFQIVGNFKGQTMILEIVFSNRTF
jgi:hypothetical protein